MSKLSQLLQNVSLKNFLNLSLNQGINVLVALVMTPYLFQTLGEDQFGLVNLGLTVILLFGILVNYGFNLNVPKQLALIANDRKAKEGLINEVIITRLSICFLLVLLIYVATQYLGLFEGYSFILLFATVQLLNDALYPMFILQGLDRLGWISKANAISKLTYLGLVIWLVKGPEDAHWVNFFLGGAGALVHGLLLVFIYRSLAIRLRWVSARKIYLRLQDNFQFFSSTVASYVLLNGGFIMLKNFVSESELGFYAIALRVSLILRLLPVFIAQSILQHATRLHQEAEDQFEKYLLKSCRKGLLVTFLIGLAFALTAKWVVRVLAGEYIELSAQLMAILCFLPFLGMFNVANVIRLLVKDQKRILARASWITALLMLALGAVGAHYFDSLGMAGALVVAEVFNYWIHRYFLSRIKNTAASI